MVSRGLRQYLVTMLVASSSLVPVSHQAAAAPEILQHEGYMCADIEGAHAVVAEMLNENQGYDTVWDVVDAVRAEGHDCTHTRGGPVRMKVVADVETIAGTKDPPLHIVEATNLRTKAVVFVITAFD